MDKQAIAKERSFVMKLTKKDILELLKLLGDYTLNEGIYSEYDGKKLPSIQRGYNSEKNEYDIMLRLCKNDKDMQVVQNILLSVFPHTVYNPNDTIMILSDFELIELTIDNSDQDEKQMTYAKFMYKKFGEEYRELYNNFVKKINQTSQNDYGKE